MNGYVALGSERSGADVNEFIITRDVDHDADAAIRRFHGDPAEWLPRPLTEHGVHEFRSIVRVWWRMKLTFAVGDVWQRGSSYTRRFVISTPRDKGLSLFNSVAGELTLVERMGNVSLRYNARVHPRPGRLTHLLPYQRHGEAAGQVVVDEIAAGLSTAATSELPRP